jgi:hypothetical protein
MSGLYVYALLGGPGDGVLPEAGLQGEPLRLLDWGGVLAAAGELAAPPAPTREALAAHDAAVRRLVAHAPALLPARFGQWAADPAELAAAVVARRTELAAALDLVAGCAQMTLRLFSSGPAEKEAGAGGEDEAAGGRAPLATSDSEADLAAGARSGADTGTAASAGIGARRTAGNEVAAVAGPGARYLADRQRRIAAELPPALRELRRALAPLLRAERLDRHGAPPLLATAHDLVAREDAERYRRLVAEKAAEAREWRASVSGPWPPYAFAPGLGR